MAIEPCNITIIIGVLVITGGVGPLTYTPFLLYLPCGTNVNNFFSHVKDSYAANYVGT